MAARSTRQHCIYYGTRALVAAGNTAFVNNGTRALVVAGNTVFNNGNMVAAEDMVDVQGVGGSCFGII